MKTTAAKPDAPVWAGFTKGLSSAAVLCALFMLSACAETQFVFTAAKKISAPSGQVGKREGEYKVGKPYNVNSRWYYPAVDYKYRETGIASWYGRKFHGRPTANGEIFDMNAITAAHRTLPLPSMVRVVNLRNGRSIAVRVNDRGPFSRGRIIDLSRRAAQLLGFARQGTAPVRVEIMPQESRQLAGAAQRGAATAVSAAEPQQSDEVRIADLPPPGKPAEAPEKKVQIAAADRSPVRHYEAPAEVSGASLRFEPVKRTRLFVQAGSFVRREFAERMKRKLSTIRTTRITEAVVGRYRFYRVRVGPLTTVEEGDRVLDHVIAYGYPNARLIAD